MMFENWHIVCRCIRKFIKLLEENCSHSDHLIMCRQICGLTVDIDEVRCCHSSVAGAGCPDRTGSARARAWRPCSLWAGLWPAQFIETNH